MLTSESMQMHMRNVTLKPFIGRRSRAIRKGIIYCLGFAETKSTNGATRNQLNIEKIEGYYDQAYNAIARAEDCVLLPRATRRKANLWKVPRKSKGASYGFGQSNVWFAQGREKNEYLNRFLERVIAQIEAYDGENRL